MSRPPRRRRGALIAPPRHVPPRVLPGIEHLAHCSVYPSACMGRRARGWWAGRSVHRRRINASCGGLAVKEEAAGRGLAPPGRLITMKEMPGRVARNTGNRCPMAKPFHELWRAMENWRHHIEAGEPSASCRFEQMRRPERRFSGCPDEETLPILPVRNRYWRGSTGSIGPWSCRRRQWACTTYVIKGREIPAMLFHSLQASWG